MYDPGMSQLRIAAVLLGAILTGLGCEEKTTQPKPGAGASSRGPASSPGPSTPATANGATTATPPAPAAAPTMPPGANTGTGISVLGLTLPLPAAWKQVPPGNPMRLAEVQVPDPAGDAAKACSIVFSTAGGDVQANIDRWAGQVRDAAGQPAKATPTTKTIAGLKVTTVELAGSYANMGEPAPHADWMLRGAIVEAPEGLLFSKMTGPAAPWAAAAPGFSSMIEGLKKP